MKMTKREEDVMALLVQGLTNKKIGKIIGVSDHTVRDHVSSLLKKYNAMNRVELVARHASGLAPVTISEKTIIA